MSKSSLTLPDGHKYTEGRICSTCGVFKSADNFKLERDSRAFGGVAMRSKCRSCDEHRKWKRFIVRTYKINEEQYYEMLASQNYRCKICNSDQNNSERCGSGKLFIDHCHTTKEVRGLLCHKCNLAIGYLDDDIGRLQKAIDYLKQFERKP